MALNLVNQLNTIESMKQFSKPNYNLCMEERLTVLKNLRNKCVTLMNHRRSSDLHSVLPHRNGHRYEVIMNPR